MAQHLGLKVRNCTVLRRRLVTHSTVDILSGESTDTGIEWVEGACNTPLFTDQERTSGICRTCESGWEHPDNFTISPNQDYHLDAR